MDSFPDLYPLTSLQIGNIKSHLSRAFLYFAPISHKFVILVDNQSWRVNKHSRSARIRELMSTKYRMSPFKNNKKMLRSPSLGCRSSSHKGKKLHKWLPALSLTTLKEKTPFSMVNLYTALHGFIVFEVAWKDVNGINYLNELQTDASIALEVRSMRKWEFSSIDQAMSCIPSWLSGTVSESETLWLNLIHLQDKVPTRSSRGVTIASKELLFSNASKTELFSEDIFFDVRECSIDTNNKCTVNHSRVEDQKWGKTGLHIKEDSAIEPMGYKDTLLLFTFNDRDLPFKLRRIITSDLKLLALLEAGLPSWVIFLQSYPLFCTVYRPWMRPLLRTLYILISLITVVIGFYDLYKNVPVLKATAAHLCGPLFKWIEAWDMTSRISYLGTMLFLQNLEKAVKWFLTIIRGMKLSVLLLTKPVLHPLEAIVEFAEPVWIIFVNTAEQFFIIGSVILGPVCSLVLNFLEVLLSPFELLYSCILSLVSIICPFLTQMWELLLFPGRGCLTVVTYASAILFDLYEVLEAAIWTSASSMSQLTSLSQVNPNSSQISFWHSLWNDLLSKVFRALRNIIHGLVAFLTSCNRHRLSIYNHAKAIPGQISHIIPMASHRYPRFPQVPQLDSPQKADHRKCHCCKSE